MLGSKEEYDVKQLVAPEDYELCLKDSEKEPVFLFKHSTRCPISARADSEVRSFFAKTGAPPCYVVLVVESRPLSLSIAADLKVEHQSPQLILIGNRHPVWSASHSSINEEAIQGALASIPERH
jgi:bacillithiol system protein YtxJ